ncbi:hypothetical protein Pelo_8279 [Pelomyxa schiedti]|nr:hypothetical protein Pelo_8279 [Pelomyxa schiedti]
MITALTLPDHEARWSQRFCPPTLASSHVTFYARQQLVAFATSWHPRCGASSPARLLWHTTNNNNHGGCGGGGGPWLARTIAADHCLALPSCAKRFGLLLVTPNMGESEDEEERMADSGSWAPLVTLGVSPATLGVTQAPAVAARVWPLSVSSSCGALVDIATSVAWDPEAGGYCLRGINQTRGGKLLMKIPDLTIEKFHSFIYRRRLHAKDKWLVWFGDTEMIVVDLHAPDPCSTMKCIDTSHFPWEVSYLFSSVHWPNELGLAVQMKADSSSRMFIVIDIEKTFTTKNLEILTQLKVGAAPEAADEFGTTALLLKKKADNTRVIVVDCRGGRVLHFDSVTGDVVQVYGGYDICVSQLNTSTFCIHSRGDGECMFTQLWECGNTAAGPVRTIEHEGSGGGGGVNDDTLQVVGGSGFLFVVGRDTIVVSDAESGVVVVTLSLSFHNDDETAFILPESLLYPFLRREATMQQPHVQRHRDEDSDKYKSSSTHSGDGVQPNPKPITIILCYVVGSNRNVDAMFRSLTRLGSCTVTTEKDKDHPTITVNRPNPLTTRTGAAAEPPLPTPPELGSVDVRKCNQLELWDKPTGGSNRRSQRGTTKTGFIFYRCNRDDELTTVARDIHPEAWSIQSTTKQVVVMLHSGVEDWDSLPGVMSKLLDPSIVGPFSNGDLPVPPSPLVMIDCSEPCDTTSEIPDTSTVVKAIKAIEMAIAFCAFKLVKWTTSSSGSPDSLLWLITETAQQTVSVCNYYNKAPPKGHPRPPTTTTAATTTESQLPPFTAPLVMEVHSASVAEAHMIMKVVHDYGGNHHHFPNLTVTMVLRMWVRANNGAAIGVVCRARFLTQFEEIDLSHMSLESVPDELRGLSCRTLNLSGNKLRIVPKWFSEMPNVMMGEGYDLIDEDKTGKQLVGIKLVLVGDTGVGKTTLLTCLKKKKTKMTMKHVPTGFGVQLLDHPIVRGKTPSWTVWELGGESLAPFHQWFLLSRSIFILVFDVREALSALTTKQRPRLYYWLNEISIARSRGDKKPRIIIPVGTHMEGITDSDASFKSLCSVLEPIFKHENVPMAFLFQLSDGKGWKCTGLPIAEHYAPTRVEHFVLDLSKCRGAIMNLAPPSWMVLNEELEKLRDKRRAPAVPWTHFVKLAVKCGVGGKVRTTSPKKIEECAHFLAETGTIIHFRYPFWLLSASGHPGAAPVSGFSEFVILERRSFLKRVLWDLRYEEGATTTLRAAAAAVDSILLEFHKFVEALRGNSVVFSDMSSSSLSLFKYPHSGEDFHEHFNSFWMVPSPSTASSSATGLSVRVIQFPLFSQELLFKLISITFHDWHIKFWWRDVVLFADSGINPHTHLLMTSRNNTVTICMRSDPLGRPQRRGYWIAIRGAVHRFSHQMYIRFEECESPLFPSSSSSLAGIETEEQFPCPHCLLQATPALENWLDPSKSIVFPAELFYFPKCDILDAVKKGEKEMTCRNGRCKVALDSIAPDLAPFRSGGLEAELKPTSEPKPSETAPLILPHKLREILGEEEVQPTNEMTLGHLVATLIEKGNGTTSVLDEVIPNILRVKILLDVALELQSLHQQSPPVAHGKICPDNILVLSLDINRGPWAKIKKNSDVSWERLFDSVIRMPESAAVSLADMNFLAPEVLSHLFFDTPADIWSFAMTFSIVMDPLEQPYTHLASSHRHERLLSTDYDASSTTIATKTKTKSKARKTTATTTCTGAASHDNNNHDTNNTSGDYRLVFNPLLGGCRLLKGDITPFPPHPSKSTHNGDVIHRLGQQIASLCLKSNPCDRAKITDLIKIWDYFLWPPSATHSKG